MAQLEGGERKRGGQACEEEEKGKRKGKGKKKEKEEKEKGIW